MTYIHTYVHVVPAWIVQLGSCFERFRCTAYRLEDVIQPHPREAAVCVDYHIICSSRCPTVRANLRDPIRVRATLTEHPSAHCLELSFRLCGDDELSSGLHLRCQLAFVLVRSAIAVITVVLGTMHAVSESPHPYLYLTRHERRSALRAHTQQFVCRNPRLYN